MENKKKLTLPVIVEGKYDKNTLSQIFDGVIIATGGFSVFNSREKQDFIRKVARDGVILLVDSDGGGRQIRSFISRILPPDKVHNLHIPKIGGKEKRKAKPSKSGLIGVEGMEREVLEKLLAPFTDDGTRVTKTGEKNARMITKVDFFNDGLSGGVGSAIKRAALARELSLPEDLSAKAMIEAINLLFDYDTYKSALNSLDFDKK